MASKAQAEEIDENDAENGQARQRSKVAFPYMDLKAAMEIANAIHENVGNGQCSLQQLSAWTGQSIKSSGFRIQLAVSRLFGLIESSSSEDYRLTLLGRKIGDPEKARKAKAEAFLNVPLFRLLYENYKEGLLPPSTALERSIAALGVAEKQKDRARQVFERSAEQAGFFEHGNNRLVMPAIAVKSEIQERKDYSSNTGNNVVANDSVANNLDPVVAALIQKLPTAKSDFPIDDRVTWLRMITMAFQMAYGPTETIDILKKNNEKND